CTRACRFCSVDTGNPHGWLDPEEPENAARTVELMKLRYVVLTSVDRDDLADGGAAHYAACVRAIKRRTVSTFCANTSIPESTTVSTSARTPWKSGVSASTAVWGLRRLMARTHAA